MYIMLTYLRTEANGYNQQVSMLRDKTQVKASLWNVVHLHLGLFYWLQFSIIKMDKGC